MLLFLQLYFICELIQKHGSSFQLASNEKGYESKRTISAFCVFFQLPCSEDKINIFILFLSEVMEHEWFILLVSIIWTSDLVCLILRIWCWAPVQWLRAFSAEEHFRSLKKTSEALHSFCRDLKNCENSIQVVIIAIFTRAVFVQGAEKQPRLKHLYIKSRLYATVLRLNAGVFFAYSIFLLSMKYSYYIYLFLYNVVNMILNHIWRQYGGSNARAITNFAKYAHAHT